MTELINEFNSMDKQPIFEIEIDSEYYIYYIQATNKGLEAGGCSNTGFSSYGLSIEWEDDYSLDYHLQELYEECYNHANEEV